MTGPNQDAERIEVIFSAEAIAERMASLAGEIGTAGLDRLLVVAVLKGSFVFAADLIRALHRARLAPQVDFLSLSSYGSGQSSSGMVTVLRDIELDVRDRNVLIVDDILESGRTLAFAKQLIAERGAKRVMSCVLLDKPGKRTVPVEADFTGFRCPDVFVVGYGMDLAHRHRELPFIGRLLEAGEAGAVT
jgi:hypoxanthine phosphoribosyltransferase